MRIEQRTSAYNERRCGKPWIAVLDFSKSSASPDYRWGEWVGDARSGSSGLLVIDAEPGDVIAIGQKDSRQPRNSAPNYFRVVAPAPDADPPETAHLEALRTKAEALAAWRAAQAAREQADDSPLSERASAILESLRALPAEERAAVLRLAAD